MGFLTAKNDALVITEKVFYSVQLLRHYCLTRVGRLGRYATPMFFIWVNQDVGCFLLSTNLL